MLMCASNVLYLTSHVTVNEDCKHFAKENLIMRSYLWTLTASVGSFHKFLSTNLIKQFNKTTPYYLFFQLLYRQE